MAPAAWTDAAAAGQFDLECSGTVAAPNAPKGNGETFRLSIDLDRRLFCDRSAGCQDVYDIAAISTARLTLLSDEGTIPRELFVSRITGTYRGTSGEGNTLTRSTGTCQISDYSNIPSQRF